MYACAVLRHAGGPCGQRERVVEERLNDWERLKLLPDANVLKLATLRVGLVLSYSRCKPHFLSTVSRWPPF